MRSYLRKFLLPLAAAAFLVGCGSSGQPFIMNSTATLIIGDAPPAVTDPVQQISEGELTAEITGELHDRFELEVIDFQLTTDFPGVGTIHMVLDPNFTSTATVFKLNRNNNPFGTNTMTLSLIVETPDQNLTFSQMSLSSNNATLELAQDLLPLNFFVDGQAKVFNLSALAIQIPVQLIVSTSDPQ